jgi:hydroxymethylglutaryl-CoA reductase
MSGEQRSSRVAGFYRLTVSERLDSLAAFARLTAEEKYVLRHEPLPVAGADMMVENVVGVMGLPLATAVNFRVNDRDYIVPMVTEESSVVAAASHIAKLVREHGSLTAECHDSVMIGQIQVTDIGTPDQARDAVLQHKAEILALANEQDPVLRELGGGARDVELRLLDTLAGPMLIVHLLVDVKDAMGANAVNTMAEAVAPMLEKLTGGKVFLRIVSNLADRRLARARLSVDPLAFSEHQFAGEDVVQGIIKAYAFAAADPYRAATHNKGIMNGVDAVVIATGNDWRAVEAGAHAYASRSGRYSPLSQWRRDGRGHLIGEIELPMAVGIVGGSTKVNPTARLALKILGVRTASELAGVVAAVGLVQNLAALRSLAAEGIQRGHMVLHARNVAVAAGAVGEMAVTVANEMVREGRIGFDRAKDILRHLLKVAHEGAHDLHMRVEQARKDQASRDDKPSDRSPS